jgi:DUF1680 family protein
MTGTRNGEAEPGKKQTRYKYSPVHQDVAVCCVPNAGRISPCFLQNCWMKEGENTLVAAVLAPNILQTSIQNLSVKIEEITQYPYQNHFVFRIVTEEPLAFRLKIRKPEWAKSIQTKEKYQLENGFLVFDRKFSKNDQIELEFQAEVRILEDLNHEKYFSYGALIFASPIAATEQKGKVYAPGFEDLTYSPLDSTQYAFIEINHARYLDGCIWVDLKNNKTQKAQKLELIPFGKTILRQASFR